jgi:hypothetical protein
VLVSARLRAKLRCFAIGRRCRKNPIEAVRDSANFNIPGSIIPVSLLNVVCPICLNVSIDTQLDSSSILIVNVADDSITHSFFLKIAPVQQVANSDLYASENKQLRGDCALCEHEGGRVHSVAAGVRLFGGSLRNSTGTDGTLADEGAMAVGFCSLRDTIPLRWLEHAAREGAGDAPLFVKSQQCACADARNEVERCPSK